MADYTKREQSRADIHRMIEAGMPPRRAMPKCECGAPAKLHVSTRKGHWFYCDRHAEQATRRFEGAR